MAEYPNHSQEPSEPDSERPQHRPEGREHQIHKEILERRMRGSEPTHEAYANALEQWKNLPGSIVRPPTDISTPPINEAPEPPDQEDGTPQSNENSNENK